MPLPGDVVTAGPMHRVPSLQWKTWVRLAFVETTLLLAWSGATFTLNAMPIWVRPVAIGLTLPTS